MDLWELRVLLATIAHAKLTIPSHGLLAASGESVPHYISGRHSGFAAGLTTSGPTSKSVSPRSAIFAPVATFFAQPTIILIMVLIKTMTATAKSGVRVAGMSESAKVVADLILDSVRLTKRTIVK